MKTNYLGTALAVALCFVASGARADLIGDTVVLRYDATGLNSTSDTLTVGGGPEVTCTGGGLGNASVCAYLTLPTQVVDIANLSIGYVYTRTEGNGAFFTATFNGFNFLDLDPGFAIGGVSLTTDIPGLDSSRISFTPDSVAINMSGLLLDVAEPGDTRRFAVGLLPAAVPEPALVTLALLGLAGIGASRARRRYTSLVRK